MSDLNNKSSLTFQQRRLLELMQAVNFGRIEDLHIRGGMPSFDPPPRVIQKFKTGSSENGARPESHLQDFWLKRPIVQLFEILERANTGKVLALEVKNGLPFSLEIEDPASAVGKRS